MENLKDNFRPFPNVLERLRITTGRRLSDYEMACANLNRKDSLIAKRDSSEMVIGYIRILRTGTRAGEMHYNASGDLIYAIRNGIKFEYDPSSKWPLSRSNRKSK